MKPILVVLLILPLFSISQTIGNTTLPIKDFPSPPLRDNAVNVFMAQFPGYQSLAKEKKDWFYWTNYSRINPKRFYDSVVEPILTAFPTLKNANSVSLKRDLYKISTLPLLHPNDNLNKVAQQFAGEMADKNASPSHTSPTGSTFPSRMESIKIRQCAGENISWGKDNTVLMLVLLYIDQGVADLGHRQSLLNASFTEMGIGYGRYKDGKYIVIQDFACNQAP